MAIYRITIEKAQTNEEGRVTSWDSATQVVASTEYKLADALEEWIVTEIDPGAEVGEPQYEECADCKGSMRLGIHGVSHNGS
jgi:hypothetical protein